MGHLKYLRNGILSVALLVVALLLLPAEAQASHMAGGYIRVVCVDAATNTYMVQLIVYRDESGINPPGSFIIHVDAVDDTEASDQVLTAPNISISDVPTVKTGPCHDPPELASLSYEKWVYETGTFTLDPASSGYNIYNATGNPPNTTPGLCCRNPEITNITGAGSVNQVIFTRTYDRQEFPCNSSPEFKNYPPSEICVDDTLAFDYSATDPNGGFDTSTVSVSENPDHGTVTFNPANGRFEYIPDPGFVGQDSFTYQVCDVSLSFSPKCDDATVYIDVAYDNIPPQATDDYMITTEGNSAEKDLLSNDMDFDGTLNPFSLKILENPNNGDLFHLTSGAMSYLPEAGFTGIDSFKYSVCDMHLNQMCDTAMAYVVVAPTMNPPLAVDDYVEYSGNSTNVDVLANDEAFNTSIDNSSLEVIEPPEHASATVIVNKVQYLPDDKHSGLDSFKYIISNNESSPSWDSATAYVIREAQDYPPFAVPDTYKIALNTTGTFDVLSNDLDQMETLQYSGVSIPGKPYHGTTTVTGGAIEYTPPSGFFGIDSFTYRICDGGDQNYCDRTKVYVVVENENYEPYAGDDNYLLEFNTGATLNVAENDFDREVDLETNGTIQIINGPDNGTATVNGIDVDYTPDAGFNGIDKFTYSICDNASPPECDTALVTIFVKTDNYLPFVGIDTAMPYCFNPVDINVVASDNVWPEDFNLNSLNITVPPSNGTATITGDSTITYEADSGYVGIDSFTYEICDDNGDCESDKVYIHSNELNLPPDARDDNLRINANSYGIADLLANDQDPEGQLAPNSFKLITNPANGQVFISQQGEMLYEPDAGFSGVETFIYEVCDFGIPSRCDQAEVRIIVEASSPPEAFDDNFTLSSFGPSSIDVLANDVIAIGSLDKRTLSIKSPPSHGDLIIDHKNRFVYYPTDTSVSGTDEFTYSICNSGTPKQCDEATVTITFDYNEGPDVNDDNVQVEYGKPVFFDPLENDSDPDGELRFETAEIVTPPSNGTVYVLADSGMIYMPDENYSGPDQFEYKICDNGMSIYCKTATVDITVSDNDPPEATDDTKTVRFNAPTLVDVAANDTDPAGDLDPASVRVVTSPSNGLVALDLNGGVFYQPYTDYFGLDSFEYQIADRANPLQKSTAKVYVRVGYDPAYPELAKPDFHSLANNEYGIFSMASNDDPSIDHSTFKVIDSTSHGDAFILPNGEVYYKPDTNYVGNDSLRYLVCQSPQRIACDTAVVNFTMNEVDYPITANNDQADVYEDHYRDVYVLENDVDKDRYTAGYTMSISSAPAKGTATVLPNGAIRYNAANGETGADMFEYEVCDNLGCDQATVDITLISSANVSPSVLHDRYEINIGDPFQFSALDNDIDPDQDSLAYRFCAALEGNPYNRANMPPFAIVPYAAGYSATVPALANPPLEIDPVTGMLTGVPNVVSNVVITVCAEEYKNGKFLSDTRSEVQVKIVDCSNTPDPAIDPSIMNGGPNTILVCDGRTVDFQHMSSNITEFEHIWDFGLPNVASDTSTELNPSFTYPDTGTYQATLTIAPGAACEQSATVTVKIYDSPKADFTYDEPLCRDQEIQFHDESDPVNQSLVSWTWNFSATQVKTGQNPTHTYGSLGNKSVELEVVSQTGCTDNVTKNFEINPSPVLDLPKDVLQVCVDDTITVEAEHTSITSLTWSPQNNLIETGNPAIVRVFRSSPGGGQYNATAVNQHGCEVTASFIFNAIQRPSVDAGDDKRLCTAENVNILTDIQGLQFNPSISWSPAAGLSDPTNANPLASPDSTTTYTLTLSKDNGKYCIETDTVKIHTELPELDIEPEKPILCENDYTQLNPISNTDRTTFEWSPASSLSASDIRYPIASPDETTTYTLSMYDSITQCAVTDTITLQVKKVTGLNAGPDTTICRGDTTLLTATEGNRFIWKQDTTLSCLCCDQPKAFPLEETTYTLTGFDDNGCRATDSVTVSIVPKPEFNVSNDTIVCPGEPVDIEFGGETVSYIWYDDQSQNCSSCSSIQVTGKDTTKSYIIGGESDEGCIVLDTVTVDVYPPPKTGSSAPPTLCRGDTTQLEVTGAATYNWSPDSTVINPNISNPLVFPYQNTDYVVEGLDTNGCAYSDTIPVSVNVLQEGSFISDSSICIGDSITLFANGFSQYEWSPDSTLTCDDCPEPLAFPEETTTYFAKVEDDNGCKDSSQVTITVNPLPVITLTVEEDSFCVGESVQLTAGGGTDYNWTPTLGLSDPGVSDPIAEPTSDVEYSVTVTDNNGCVSDTSQPLVVHPLPETDAGPDTAICYQDTLQLQATGADTYEWEGGSGYYMSCTDCADPVVAPELTTEYTVTGYNQFGCIFRDSIEVQVNPEPEEIEISNDTTICIGDSAQLSVSGASTYEWLPTPSLSCVDCSDPVATPTSTELFSVQVFTNASCYRYFDVEIEVRDLPESSVSEDTGVCITNSVTLEASGGSNYEWQPPATLSDPTSSSPEATPTEPTEYAVRISDDIGCYVWDTVFVDVYIPKDPNAQPDTLVCEGMPVTVSAENGVTYNWSPANVFEDPTAASETIVLDNSEELVVEITDDNNCYNSDTIFVDVKPNPVFTTSGDVTVYEGTSTTLAVQGADSYSWEPTRTIIDSGSSSITVMAEDTAIDYYITGYSEFGCEAYDSIRVMPVPEMEIYMPNAFSPNGDGVNDYFSAKSNVNYELVSLKIFDRWGNLIFNTDEPEIGWDGTVSGEPMPIGTYIYLLEARDELGKTVHKQGNLILVR